MVEPPPEVVNILLPAYSPCPAFQGACSGSVRWKPGRGHVPRGFRGGTGLAAEVELVLVCAEPGNPYEPVEPASRDPRDYLRMVYTASCQHLERRVDQFARNIRVIMDMAWPGVPFEEQMRKTWLTESVLCSAPMEGGNLPAAVERECVERYFLKQLALFRNARIVALGKKAQNRLKRAGVRFVPASAASPPGCNRPEARESWRTAVNGLRS